MFLSKPFCVPRVFSFVSITTVSLQLKTIMVRAHFFEKCLFGYSPLQRFFLLSRFPVYHSFCEEFSDFLSYLANFQTIYYLAFRGHIVISIVKPGFGYIFPGINSYLCSRNRCCIAMIQLYVFIYMRKHNQQ